jgi:hypothetical protein
LIRKQPRREDKPGQVQLLATPTTANQRAARKAGHCVPCGNDLRELFGELPKVWGGAVARPEKMDPA